jgi:hypothetical protein
VTSSNGACAAEVIVIVDQATGQHVRIKPLHALRQNDKQRSTFTILLKISSRRLSQELTWPG